MRSVSLATKVNPLDGAADERSPKLRPMIDSDVMYVGDRMNAEPLDTSMLGCASMRYGLGSMAPSSEYEQVKVPVGAVVGTAEGFPVTVGLGVTEGFSVGFRTVTFEGRGLGAGVVDGFFVGVLLGCPVFLEGMGLGEA